MHEAFAEVVVSDPSPGIVVPKLAPQIIEELPPTERPEGSNISWIPGYWAWDDDEANYIWISGVWRDIPPGRQWVPGYWLEVQGGSQWIGGYWADVSVREVVYLPEPPATLEIGPSVTAVSADQIWIPGCWIWSRTHYVWQPGYWTVGRPDWVWTPPHYSYSPRGCVFVSGYWDRPIARRGVCYAPVYVEPSYVRASFSFRPSFVLDLNVVVDHLFLRPRYCHYYFGDYYDTRYYDRGIYASFTYFSTEIHHRDRFHCYDPIYAHHRWEHRHDSDWHRRIEADFHHRREHRNARPPHTFHDQQRVITAEGGKSRDRSFAIATTLDKSVAREGARGSFKTRAVTAEETRDFSERAGKLRKFRDDRRSVEKSADVAKPRGDAKGQARIQRAKFDRSPIMRKPSADFSKDEAPPSAPRPPKAKPKTEDTGKGSGKFNGDAQQPGRPGREGKFQTPDRDKPRQKPSADRPGKGRSAAKPETGKVRAPKGKDGSSTQPGNVSGKVDRPSGPMTKGSQKPSTNSNETDQKRAAPGGPAKSDKSVPSSPAVKPKPSDRGPAIGGDKGRTGRDRTNDRSLSPNKRKGRDKS